ncbi:MAG: alpha/beta hydrolase, partial [Verrucomicrobiota bacterium]
MHLRPYVLACFIWLAIPTATRAQETSEPPFEIDGAAAEIYKETPQGSLRIHRLDPPGHDVSEDQKPAIVFFFGGGWNGGTPS